MDYQTIMKLTDYQRNFKEIYGNLVEEYPLDRSFHGNYNSSAPKYISV